MSTIVNGVVQRKRPTMDDDEATKDASPPPETIELPFDLVKDPTATSANNSKVQRPKSAAAKRSGNGAKKERWLPLDLSPPQLDAVDDGTSGHVCADCGKKCNSAAQLSNHKRNHNKVRCPAPWCDYVGKRWDQVKTHMRNRHHLLHETEAGSPSGRSATKRRSASSGDKEAGSSSGRSATKRRSASSDVDDGPKETKRVRLGSDGVQQSNVVDSVKPKDPPSETSSSSSFTVSEVSRSSSVAAAQSVSNAPTWSHSAPIPSAGLAPQYGYYDALWRAYVHPDEFYVHAGTSGDLASPVAAQHSLERLQHVTDHDYATGDGSGGPGVSYFSLL